MRKRNSRRGNVILESALTFGPFLFMLIGVLDFGQFLYLHQALTERARSSARWGATQAHAFDSTLQGQVQNLVVYGQSTTPNNPPAGYFGLSTSNVQVSSTTPDADTGYYQIVVRITGYRYLSLSPYIAGSLIGRDIVVSSASEYTP